MGCIKWKMKALNFTADPIKAVYDEFEFIHSFLEKPERLKEKCKKTLKYSFRPYCLSAALTFIFCLSGLY